MPRLDYGNATFARLPASQLRRHQSVLNAAARLIQTDVAGPALAAVSGTHRLQAGCVIRLSMTARSRATVFLITSSASPIPTAAISGRLFRCS